MAGFPSYRYHATEAPVVVNDEAEDKALGKGWHDAPVEAEDADTAAEIELAAEEDAPAKAPKKGAKKR